MRTSSIIGSVDTDWSMLQNVLQYTPSEKLRLKEELLFLQQDILWAAQLQGDMFDGEIDHNYPDLYRSYVRWLSDG